MKLWAGWVAIAEGTCFLFSSSVLMLVNARGFSGGHISTLAMSRGG